MQGQTNRVQSARKLAFSAYAEVRTALGEAKGSARREQNPRACSMVMPSRRLRSTKLRAVPLCIIIAIYTKLPALGEIVNKSAK